MANKTRSRRKITAICSPVANAKATNNPATNPKAGESAPSTSNTSNPVSPEPNPSTNNYISTPLQFSRKGSNPKSAVE